MTTFEFLKRRMISVTYNAFLSFVRDVDLTLDIIRVTSVVDNSIFKNLREKILDSIMLIVTVTMTFC